MPRWMSLSIAAIAFSLVLTSCGGAAMQRALVLAPQIRPWISHVVPFFNYGGGKADSLGSGGFGGLTIDTDGTIYGAATYGGDKACVGVGQPLGIKGCGLVYALKPDSSGSTYSETVLHVFPGGTDGNSPTTALLKVGRNFYGATELGGGCNYSGGCGSVFEITPEGKETIVYAFDNVTGGAQPRADLVANRRGDLFGATILGGVCTGCSGYGNGTVFELIRHRSSYQYKLVHAFSGTDGSLPGSLLLQNGTIFGTAYGGFYGAACYGSQACGTVFELIPRPAGYKFVLLHKFAGGNDGSGPNRLVAGPNGVFYGNAALGGGQDCGKQTFDGGCGVVYSLTPKNGSYVESIIHRFGPFADGQLPANITYYNGKIYGITVAGGIDRASCLSPQGAEGKPPHRMGCGTVYSLDRDGKNYQVIYRFQGRADGYWPLAGLVESNGSLYGTTLLGGKYGAGTAYKVTIAP